MNVNIKRLHPDAQIPQYAHSTDAGFDLVAVEDVIVEPGKTVKVPTGLAFEIPVGYEMQIRPRSGITTKTKLRVQLGTIDSGYRGEVSVMVDNIVACVPGDDDYHGYVHYVANVKHYVERTVNLHPNGTIIIHRGDRIAQAVIAPINQASFTVVDELNDSDRGTNGFGSTNVGRFR